MDLQVFAVGGKDTSLKGNDWGKLCRILMQFSWRLTVLGDYWDWHRLWSALCYYTTKLNLDAIGKPC